MATVMVVWAFVKANWLPILLVAIGTGMFTRYEIVKAERDHYELKVTAQQEQISQLTTDKKNLQKMVTDMTAKALEQQKEANAAAAAITAKYQTALQDKEALTLKNEKLNVERIRNAKELASVKLSLRAVQLFNASKDDSSSGAGVQSSPAISGNAQVTSPTGKIVTLTDLFVVVAHNDAAHLDCIHQVQQWQSFWKDVQIKYSVALNSPSV